MFGPILATFVRPIGDGRIYVSEEFAGRVRIIEP